MKTYNKPEITITSYEAEQIMLTSGVGAQNTVKSIDYSTIDF